VHSRDEDDEFAPPRVDYDSYLFAIEELNDLMNDTVKDLHQGAGLRAFIEDVHAATTFEDQQRLLEKHVKADLWVKPVVLPDDPCYDDPNANLPCRINELVRHLIYDLDFVQPDRLPYKVEQVYFLNFLLEKWYGDSQRELFPVNPLPDDIHDYDPHGRDGYSPGGTGLAGADDREGGGGGPRKTAGEWIKDKWRKAKAGIQLAWKKTAAWFHDHIVKPVKGWFGHAESDVPDEVDVCGWEEEEGRLVGVEVITPGVHVVAQSGNPSP
jgi:hypothetical protein